MDFDTAFVVPDERRVYGEARFRAFDQIGGRLHVLALTMLSETLRAISLREANSREVKRHGGP